jgi:hypothetical protein
MACRDTTARLGFRLLFQHLKRVAQTAFRALVTAAPPNGVLLSTRVRGK